MFFRTTYLHGGSDRWKKKRTEKQREEKQGEESRTENLHGRGRKKKSTDTKQNAICPMAFAFHLCQLGFSENTNLNCAQIENVQTGNAKDNFFKRTMSRLLIRIKSNPFLRLGASITVEASFIAVAVIMAVFLCVYYGFFLHDKAVLEEISWQTAQKAMFFITENSDMEEGFFDWEALQKKGLLWRFAKNTADQNVICEYANRRLTGELFACDRPELSIVCDAGKVQITYRAHIRLLLFPLMRMWGTPSEITGCVQVSESKQEEFIRMIRAIMRDKEDKKDDAQEKQ